MYFKLLELRACFLPFRTRVIFSFTSRAPSPLPFQAKCGKGFGSCCVFGSQANCSRASMGTIQLLMLVPKPLEWKGPCQTSSAFALLDNSEMSCKQNSPMASSRTIDDRAQTSRSTAQTRKCAPSLLRSASARPMARVWRRSIPSQARSRDAWWDHM